MGSSSTEAGDLPKALPGEIMNSPVLVGAAASEEIPLELLRGFDLRALIGIAESGERSAEMLRELRDANAIPAWRQHLEREICQRSLTGPCFLDTYEEALHSLSLERLVELTQLNDDQLGQTCYELNVRFEFCRRLSSCPEIVFPACDLEALGLDEMLYLLWPRTKKKFKVRCANVIGRGYLPSLITKRAN